jgi:hypothetical protein
MSKRIIAMLFGVLAIGVIAAGCGSSSDSTSSTSSESSASSLTKAEFIKQGDAICTTSNKQIETEATAFLEEEGLKEGEEPSEAQQEEVIADVVAPGVAQQGEKIADLGAPSGEEEAVAEIVDAVETAAGEVEAEPSLLLEEEEGSGPFTEANELATEYGFKVCGEE